MTTEVVINIIAIVFLIAICGMWTHLLVNCECWEDEEENLTGGAE